ncbi:hypothetical protein F2Q69_00041539 [Brassica cretica]|uniref:Uncharacterized protein n=1 Tax=Brassica cretica TaxID=69181 RepID=A0A8S9NEP5_BRACR|nr:hypothetical protein F2Q69_00041539 [Brassica cretica]
MEFTKEHNRQPAQPNAGELKAVLSIPLHLRRRRYASECGLMAINQPQPNLIRLPKSELLYNRLKTFIRSRSSNKISASSRSDKPDPGTRPWLNNNVLSSSSTQVVNVPKDSLRKMAQRYRMWLRKSKLLTRNMKGEKAEAHTSLRIYNEVARSDITRPWLYETYLGSTGTPVVNVTKATISATNALSKFPRNKKMLSHNAKLLKRNMRRYIKGLHHGICFCSSPKSHGSRIVIADRSCH